MKFQLTITDASPSDIQRLMAALNGSTAAVTPQPVIAGVGPVQQTNDDEDESGDNTAVIPGQVDADNLPHDNRIHSEPAKLTGKGVWRKKRGVSDALVKQVEAELRARTPIPAPQQQYVQPQPMFDAGTPAPAMTPPATVPMPVPAPTAVPQPVPQMPQTVAVPPPVSVQPTAPVAPPQAGTLDFNGFMQHIQAMLPQNIVDAPYLATVAQRIGAAFQQPVNSITDIMNNQQMIDYAIQVMASEGRWR